MRQLTPATCLPAVRAWPARRPRGARLGRTVAVALVALAWVAGTDIAGADCSGPQVDETPGEVARGETLTVAGTGFGSNCYDTGPPPPGEGTLGIPLDIDITFEQGDTRVLVARGAADATYEFEVDVVVPGGLQPGPANLIVNNSAIDPPRDLVRLFTITDAPAPAPEPVQEVKAFGPARPADVTSTPAPSAPPAGQLAPPVDGLRPADDSAPVLLLGAAAAAIVGAGGWFGIRRRS